MGTEINDLGGYGPRFFCVSLDSKGMTVTSGFDSGLSSKMPLAGLIPG
jgi:hypothetical protein